MAWGSRQALSSNNSHRISSGTFFKANSTVAKSISNFCRPSVSLRGKAMIDTGSNGPVSSSWIPICSSFLPLDIRLSFHQFCRLTKFSGPLHKAEAIASFHIVHGVLKARMLKCFAIPFSSGPCFVRTLHQDQVVLGCPHGMAHSFIELHKAVIHVIILVRNLSNLRFAADITLMAENKEELKSFLIKVKEES